MPTAIVPGLPRLGAIVSICEHLCCDPPALTEARQVVVCSVADKLPELLERWDRKRAEEWYPRQEGRAPRGASPGPPSPVGFGLCSWIVPIVCDLNETSLE